MLKKYLDGCDLDMTMRPCPLGYNIYVPLLGNCLYLHFYNSLICIYCIYISQQRIIASGYICL